MGIEKGQIVPGGLITVANPLEGPQGPLIFGPKWVKHAEGEVGEARDGPYLSSRSGSDTPGNQGRALSFTKRDTPTKSLAGSNIGPSSPNLTGSCFWRLFCL